MLREDERRTAMKLRADRSRLMGRLLALLLKRVQHGEQIRRLRVILHIWINEVDEFPVTVGPLNLGHNVRRWRSLAPADAEDLGAIGVACLGGVAHVVPFACVLRIEKRVEIQADNIALRLTLSIGVVFQSLIKIAAELVSLLPDGNVGARFTMVGQCLRDIPGIEPADKIACGRRRRRLFLRRKPAEGECAQAADDANESCHWEHLINPVKPGKPVPRAYARGSTYLARSGLTCALLLPPRNRTVHFHCEYGRRAQ